MKSDQTITVVCSDEACKSLMPFLQELQKMGSQGASRKIKIEGWDGRSDFGFDGDGASKISSIEMSGGNEEKSEPKPSKPMKSSGMKKRPAAIDEAMGY